jgi:hypothetical protein
MSDRSFPPTFKKEFFNFQHQKIAIERLSDTVVRSVGQPVQFIVFIFAVCNQDGRVLSGFIEFPADPVLGRFFQLGIQNNQAGIFILIKSF